MTDTEPVKEWTYKGYDCRIHHVDILDGHLCGYVQVSDEEAEGIRWTPTFVDGEVLDADVDAFGGITYGPDDDGWVGFDNGHYYDVTEKDDNPDDELGAVTKETERLAGGINIARKNDE